MLAADFSGNGRTDVAAWNSSSGQWEVGVPDGNHNLHFWSYHPNMAMFQWADGSARPLSYDTDFQVFQALSTRAGGETVFLP